MLEASWGVMYDRLPLADAARDLAATIPDVSDFWLRDLTSATKPYPEHLNGDLLERVP